MTAVDIVLVDHDPRWLTRFELERARIADALDGRALAIDHVGSTSVPGLAAKPIVDINLVVADSGDEAAYVPRLVAAGYRFIHREPDWHEHRLLKTPENDVNLHVLSTGSPEPERMRMFRDWLRSHPDDRERYEAAKRALAQRRWPTVQDYADAKTDVIATIMSRAVAATDG